MKNLFCQKHIIGLIWTAMFIIILFIISKKTERKKLLKIGSLFLIVLELIKYIVLFTKNEFTLNDLPLQFCSLVLYIYPIIAFSREKTSKFFLPFAFSCGFLAGLIALILPTNILGNPDYSWFNLSDPLPLISFIYHSFMVFYSLYLITSNFYYPKYKDIYKTLVLLIIFVSLATIANLVLDQDFMMLNYGKGNPLNFINEKSRVLYYLIQLISFVILNTLLISFVKITKKQELAFDNLTEIA